MTIRRRTALIIAAACVLVAVGVACSKKEWRYPEDHKRYLKIDAAVEELRSAYVRKDLSAMQSLFLPSGKLDRVEQDISKDFGAFQEITLELSIERIVVDGEMIDVYVHWAGLWRRNEADTGVRERGHGMLRLAGEHSVLLHSVDGDLPFGMAIRKPEQKPGGTP